MGVYDITQADIEAARSSKFSKSVMSDPSRSIDDIDIPEVFDQKAEFIYNFYDRDERINPYQDVDKKLPLDKVARYVRLSWQSNFTASDNELLPSIANNPDKIVSEDNFFNPGYVNHTFSDVESIEQGASDLENYSRISQTEAESVFKMAKYHIKEVATSSDESDSSYQQQIATLTETYTTLSDFPVDSLGLRVYDNFGRLNDKDDLMRSISNSLSLGVKINCSVIPDIFDLSKDGDRNYSVLLDSHANSVQSFGGESLYVSPVSQQAPPPDPTSLRSILKNYNLVGYVIDRYSVTQQGFIKESTFYVEDINQTNFVDRDVLYGKTYVYSIRTIASVNVLTKQIDDTGPRDTISNIYVSSRPMSVPIECYEYVPPPEPNEIRFSFDYVTRKLTVIWDMPVNPQKDVKQFQVFRRKSIKEPFELIAQYGFDTTSLGQDMMRYKTGEIVDANNLDQMSSDYRYLVKLQNSDKTDSSTPVYSHEDEDFYVDPEFLTSSDYIYAVCAVDAHGMISNYSSQHRVTFDPYKNRLMTQLICDAGSPRQYPNMKLRVDAFKDVISVQGDSTKSLNVYFTPEYIRVKDDRGQTYRVVEGQTPVDKNSHYLLQMINLDNQKMQLLRINVKDTKGLTIP